MTHRKKQTTWESFKESVTQLTIGFILAVITQVIVFPWYGIEVNLYENMEIAGIFTAVSLVRLFVIRLAHEHKIKKRLIAWWRGRKHGSN